MSTNIPNICAPRKGLRSWRLEMLLFAVSCYSDNEFEGEYISLYSTYRSNSIVVFLRPYNCRAPDSSDACHADAHLLQRRVFLSPPPLPRTPLPRIVVLDLPELHVGIFIYINIYSYLVRPVIVGLNFRSFLFRSVFSLL
jgi:hypothetical protein